MEKRSVWLLIIILLVFRMPVISVSANNTIHNYNSLLEDDYYFSEDVETLEPIKAEIFEQAKAVLNINQIDIDLSDDDIDLNKAVKAILIINKNQDNKEFNNEIEQLDKAKEVLIENANADSSDIYNNPEFNYCWKIPVVETDSVYIYATAIIHETDKVSITTSYVPFKTLSDVTYLFDADLIIKAFQDNGYDYNNLHTLLLSFPDISTDAILFISGNEIGIIPFSPIWETIGVNNGSVYSYDDFSDIIKKLYSSQSNGAETDPYKYSGGGSGWINNDPSRKTQEDNRWLTGIIIIILSASILGVSVILIRKKIL